MRKACGRLGIIVSVEAETVEPRTRRLATAVQGRPRPVVDPVEAGIHLGVASEGMGRLRVNLQEGVGEHRAGRKQERVDAQLLPGGKAKEHARPARRRRGIIWGREYYLRHALWVGGR